MYHENNREFAEACEHPLIINAFGFFSYMYNK